VKYTNISFSSLFGPLEIRLKAFRKKTFRQAATELKISSHNDHILWIGS